MADFLKKFMEWKPFDKITVKEIIEDCDISRPTFYYHFEDIYALMEWMFRTEMIDLLDITVHGDIVSALQRSAASAN